MAVDAAHQLPQLVTQPLVAGRWTGAGPELPVLDPTTGSHITSVSSATSDDVSAAISAGQEAERTWRSVPAVERAAMCAAIADMLLSASDDLATVISSEVGKPLTESVAEVEVSSSFFRWASGQAPRATGMVLTSPVPNITLSTRINPVGLIVAITPWNFPLAMVARKIAAPLALGCPVVLKPSEQAPLTALFLAKLIQNAGVPDGVLSVLPTGPGEATERLLSDERVRHVSFTGSAATGQRIHALLAGRSSVGWSAELGGNAPVLVLDDADVEKAAAMTANVKFRNAGQTCIAPNRIIVADSVIDPFVEAFRVAVDDVVVGSWHEPTTTMGPLKSRDRLAAVRRHLEDAEQKGACILGGESRDPAGSGSGNFMDPAVVLDWTPDMLLAKEETFGPVAPICSAGSVQDMLTLANKSNYGLAAYVFGSDLSRVTHVVDSLEYGVIGVNQLASAFANAPIGGWGASGIGIESGVEGTSQYLRPKMVATDIGPPPS